MDPGGRSLDLHVRAGLSTLVAVVLLVVPACTNPAGFIRVPTAIRGAVTVAGEGLAGASVEITRPRAADPTVVETDAEGVYTYQLAEAGLHRIKVSGYDRSQYVFADSSRVLDARFTGEVFVVDFEGQPVP